MIDMCWPHQAALLAYRYLDQPDLELVIANILAKVVPRIQLRRIARISWCRSGVKTEMLLGRR